MTPGGHTVRVWEAAELFPPSFYAERNVEAKHEGEVLAEDADVLVEVLDHPLEQPGGEVVVIVILAPLLVVSHVIVDDKDDVVGSQIEQKIEPEVVRERARPISLLALPV